MKKGSIPILALIVSTIFGCSNLFDYYPIKKEQIINVGSKIYRWVNVSLMPEVAIGNMKS
jgi:hypothetical protein